MRLFGSERLMKIFKMCIRDRNSNATDNTADNTRIDENNNGDGTVSGELINNKDFIIFNYIILILMHQVMGTKCKCNIMPVSYTHLDMIVP